MKAEGLLFRGFQSSRILDVSGSVTRRHIVDQLNTLIAVSTYAPIAITVVVLVFVFLVFRKVFGGISRNNALLTNGEPAQATVLQLWDTGVSLNDNPQVGLVLEVRPQNRPAYQVQTKSFISRLKVSQVQTGAVVAVKVDPTDPAKVALDLH
jgi:hypothetical protein